MEAAITAEGLRKVFRVREPQPGFLGALRGLVSARTREVVALADVGFTLRAGERVAFLGPNGAGKSTTIKILTGILHPSAGTATVLGHVPWAARRRLAARIGVVFGQRSQLWWHLPAGDTFDLLRHVYGVDRDAHRRRREILVTAFALEPLMSRPVRALSLGERMRCELAASLLHAPAALFLDEPTIGLDVSAKAALRDLIRDVAERDGCAVLLTSHDSGDMERVCDRALVLHQGRLLLDRPVATLRSGFIRRKIITLLTTEAAPAPDLPGVTVRTSEPHRLVLEVDTARTPVEKAVAAALAGARVQDLSVEDPPMDEIIRAIYADADAAARRTAPAVTERA